MDIKVTTRLPSTAENACQIAFIFSDGKLSGSARKIDVESQGLIQSLLASGDYSATPGQIYRFHGIAGTAASRVLLVGLGDRKQANASVWRVASAAAACELNSTNANIALSDCLTTIKIDSLSPADMIEQFVSDLVCAAYVFNLHPGVKVSTAQSITQCVFSIDKKNSEAVNEGARRGLATGNGISVAKDLGNLAPNFCTPSYLSQTALTMADKFDQLTTTIVDEGEMATLGMGALLAVSQGSRQPAKLIVMNYQGKTKPGARSGARDDAPVILVGKGVTFDTGGISIKSSDGMDEMKYDMCGAASVFGAIQAVAELELELNVIGIVAAAENMPDGNAVRPGDVITSMSGQSIEILNTDAEGRLVLCDALTYAKQFEPSAVIDMATLTGACVVALGNVASAVMGNHQDTIDSLIAAGNKSGDRCWQLPIWDDYQKQLDSNFADIANIGGRQAGAITAACFLARFAKDYNWAHLDIAGVAWQKGAAKGASGRPVPLLMQYLFNRL